MLCYLFLKIGGSPVIKYNPDIIYSELLERHCFRFFFGFPYSSETKLSATKKSALTDFSCHLLISLTLTSHYVLHLI